MQYEEIDGAICLAAARGVKADWYRNIVANSQVQVRVKLRQFMGTAESITDPARIADFLEYRLQRPPDDWDHPAPRRAVRHPQPRRVGTLCGK